MKKVNIKNLLPHLIAVIIFLVIAVIYCKPALEGKVLQQHDITQWQGAIQNSVEYGKTHNGKYPLWTNGLFSGMPAFQIGGIGGNLVAYYAQTILSLGLPKPINFFFLASICFYILCMCLRVRPFVAIIGSLAYAYATYNPIIIAVGHDTKMLAIALMPALLGAILLIFNKKYWLGFVLTTLFSSMIIAVNHLQIVYYLFIAIGVMAFFLVVRYIRQKNFKHIGITAALASIAIAIGILSNAEILMSTYEYQKETIRGGGSTLSDTTKKQSLPTNGLDKDYAFSYSMGISEPFVLMVPRMLGGSSDKEEVSQDKSKAIEAMSSMPQELQQQLPLSYYWGGIGNAGSVGTSGPPYVGAIICFLAILGMVLLDNKYKWWMLAAILLTILMSWGGYFESFNTLLYKYLPFYNKFRAPSMIMVIPQMLLTTLAVLCVDTIINTEDKKILIKPFIKGLAITGSIFLLLFLLYFSFDFLSTGDKAILKQIREMNQPQLAEMVRTFFDGLKQDRQSLMLGDIFRSLGFIVLAAVLIFLLIKKVIPSWVTIAGIALFAFIDVMLVDTTYLNSENYQDKETNEVSLAASPVDNEILADKSDYRVFNMSGNRFQENFTSYLYKSVGGYHPAKLRIYQDLIERQLSLAQPNINVLNMLNAKYIIQKDGTGVTRQYQKNDGALGTAWLVKHIQFVKNADEEMAALNNFNPKDTAIIQETFKKDIPFLPETDSTANIRLIKNDNDIVTYQFNAGKNQFAVFSEIYYKSGWKALIDGKEAPIVKVNYVLRGLALSPGKHTIEFRFEPWGYLMGSKLGKIFMIMIAIIVIIYFIRSIFIYLKKQ